MIKKLILFIFLSSPLQAIKPCGTGGLIPCIAGGLGIVVSSGTIYRGIKKTPKVIKAIPKGPKEIIKVVKEKKK